MKPKSTLRPFLSLAGSSLLAISSASAQTSYWWDSNSTTAGFGNTAGTWGSSTFWSTNSNGTGATANTTITSADTVNFGTATLAYGTGNIAIGIASGGVTTGGIVIGAGQNQQITLGTSGNALTIHGGGITKNAGSANFIISSPIILGANQTWTNNSSTNLSTPDGTTNFINNGGFNLTVDGTGTTVFGILNPGTQSLSGSGALIKNGTGTLQIGGNNTGFSGNITVNGGTLFYGDNVGALGTGNINITNGIIEGRWDGALSRSQGTTGTTIQITGGVSGFSNGRNAIFGMGASATWGSATFNPTEFVLQGSGAGSIRFSTAIDLNGADRTIRSDNANAAAVGNFTGVISGTGAGIIKVGVGHQLFENAANSYSGATTINAGILTARVLANGGSNSSIGSSSSAASNLVIGNGATFRYDGSGHSTNRSFTINGTADGHGASLDASGTGAANFTNTASPAYGTVDQTRTLTLTGTSTFNNTLAANIANNGTGAVSLTKTGAGLWVLSGTSNYSGPTTLNAGTLSVSAASNLGSAASNLVFNGGTLQISNTTNLPNFAAMGRTVLFTSGQTVGLDVTSGGIFTVDQVLNQGAGGLNKAGVGTLVINSAHTYTGVTTISAGTLQLGSGTATGSLSTSGTGINIASGATFAVNQSDAVTQGSDFNAFILGSGSLSNVGAGSLVLNTPTFHTGNTTATAGNVTLSHQRAIQFSALDTTGAGSVTLSGTGASTPIIGGLANSGTTRNLASVIDSSYASVTNLTLNPQSGSSFTYGGVIADGATGMTLTKTGAGTQVLHGANTYSGTTFVNGGTLQLNFSLTGAPTSNIINNASALSLGGGQLTVTGKASTTTSQTFTSTSITGGANTITNTANATANPQLVTLGAMTRSVGGTVNFSAITGTASTTNGTVSSTGNNGAGILGGWATFNNANWAVTNGTSAITGGATYYTTTTGGTTGSNYNNTRNMDVSGSVTMVGTINPNTIRFNVAAASIVTLAAGDNIVDSGGILITSTVGNNLSTITGGNLAGSAGGDLVIHQHNTSNGLTIDSLIKDNTSATALTKSGGGTLTLSGLNTFSGGVFINAGTLQIASAANLGDSANVVTFAGAGSLKFTADTTLSQGFVINEGVTATLDAYNYNITINNSLSGSGTLWALNGGDPGRSFTFTSTNNTFSGNIQISNSAGGSYSAGLIMASLADTPGSRIRLGNNNSTASFTYGAGAVAPLVLNNRRIEHNANIASLNNNATNVNSTVTVNTDLILSGSVGNKPFTLGGSNTGNNTFAGAITNGAGYVTSLTKAGAGTWVLTNANTYSGGTTLTAGNLQVGVNSVGSVGSITSSAVGTGTLTFNGGGISSNGTAARTILNPISFTGNASLGDATNTGKLTFSADAALGGATRTLTVNSDAEFSGIISSTGAFGMTKAGTGTLILSGGNTYTGTTSLTAGTLAGTQTSGTPLGTGAVTLSAGILSLAPTGSGSAVSVTGGTVAAGTLFTYNAGATLSLNRGSQNSLTYTFGGTGATTARGTNGTLILSTSDIANFGAAGTNLERFIMNGTAPTQVNTLVSGVVIQDRNTSNAGEFATYDATNGFTKASYTHTNTFTGSTNVSRVEITSATSTGSIASYAIKANAAVTNSGTITLGSSGNPAALILNGGSINGGTLAAATGNPEFLIYTSGTSSISSAITSTNTGMSIFGPGSLTLSSSNSFTGGLRVNNSTLIVTNDNQLGGANNALTLTGGTLQTSGASLAIGAGARAITLAAGQDKTGGTFDVSSGTTTYQNASSGTRIISGSGSLTKTGTGILALSGNTTNTYTGGTLVNQGTLRLDAGNMLADTGVVTVGGGTFDIQTFSDTVGAVTLTSGSITGSGGTLTGSSYAVQSGSVSAILGGTGALTKSTAGTVTLTGSNTYSGATTVSAGTLAIGTGGSINSSSGITIGSGGHFKYNSSTALTAPVTNNGGTISGTGTIGVAVNLNSTSDVIAPGNSPGIQLYGTGQTWSSFTYEWETNNFTGTTAGTDFDQIQITGGLDLTGAVAGSYILDLISLTALNAAGYVPNFAEVNRSWDILTATGGITGFNASYWTIDHSTGLNTFTSNPAWGGTWSLSLNDTAGTDSLVLTYTAAVPEPGAALIGGLGLLVLLRRRRTMIG